MQKFLQSDVQGEIDLNPQMAVERVDAWVDGAVRLAPNLVVAIIVFGLFLLAGFIVAGIVRRIFAGRGRSNLGKILGGLVRAAILVFGGLIAATIIVPSLKPGDLIAGLGVSSVAIGFAFKDILQNWLAGLLILIRQPFEIGDNIEVDGYVGTVKEIETRATVLLTFDGQRAVIPNSDIYTNAVLVKTGNEKRRSQYDIGIGYADDIDSAVDAILSAIKSVPGVEKDPAPEAFAWDLAASWVTIRARWWTDSARGDIVKTRAGIIRAVKNKLDEAAIDMPYDTQVHLFHDQTEEIDGERGKQREGWPVPKDANVPRPRYVAEKES